MIGKILATGAVFVSLIGAAQAQYYYYPTTAYPAYAAPPVVYAQPTYAAPVYAQPTYYQQPVYAAPVYASPAYSSAYYPYYSPLSLGINLGFGGRGGRRY